MAGSRRPKPASSQPSSAAPARLPLPMCAGVQQAVVSAHEVKGRKRLVGYVTPGGADLDAVRAHCR